MRDAESVRRMDVQLSIISYLACIIYIIIYILREYVCMHTLVRMS